MSRVPVGSSSNNAPMRAGGRKPPVRKKRSVIKGMAITLGVLLLILGGLVFFVMQKTGSALDLISLGSNKGTVSEAESVKNKPFAVAILGLDTRPKGVSGGGMNTDVMMVAAFNPKTQTATLISMPRDSHVDVEGYRARKANAFYSNFYQAARKEGLSAEEAELKGLEHVKKVLGKLYGIEIEYALTANFQGFRDVVDALGGIEVEVDMRMKYSDTHDGTNIDLQPGLQKLDGSQALDFVRYRKSNDGKNMSSDFDRNKRQGLVMTALADKLKSLGGISRIGSLADAVSNNLRSDMPASELKQFLATYYRLNSSKMTHLTVSGKWKSPYVYLSSDSLNEASAALQKELAGK